MQVYKTIPSFGTTFKVNTGNDNDKAKRIGSIMSKDGYHVSPIKSNNLANNNDYYVLVTPDEDYQKYSKFSSKLAQASIPYDGDSTEELTERSNKVKSLAKEYLDGILDNRQQEEHVIEVNA